jgi:hypothetical protein
MKKHLQTLLFCLSLLIAPTNARAITADLHPTDTVKQKGRVPLWTDPTYPPANGLIKGLFLTGLLMVLAGVGLLAYFTNSGTGNLGTDLMAALIVLSLIFSGLLILVITGFIWLERFMKSVNRRRKKDGKRPLKWIAIRVLQILLLLWWLTSRSSNTTIV